MLPRRAVSDYNVNSSVCWVGPVSLNPCHAWYIKAFILLSLIIEKQYVSFKFLLNLISRSIENS